MRRVAIVLAVGCNAGSSYSPGVFPRSAVITPFECLDVGVAGARRVEQTGPIVVYYLGNRCEHSVPVDIATAEVIGGDNVGRHVRMLPYDPEHELAVNRIDARIYGEEWIEYRPIEPIDRIDWLDVDVGGVEANAPQHPRWVRARVPLEASP